MGKKICVLLIIFAISYILPAQSAGNEPGVNKGDEAVINKTDEQTLQDEADFTLVSESENQPSDEPSSQSEEEISLGKFQKVNGLENWNYTFDVSGLNKGMYNIIVKGKDKAGNEYNEGAFNVLIDPDSDLPTVSITNPVKDMRVGGKSLNIVGTCVDDDEVAGVEVKIDDGNFQRAEGKTYWSYYLDTSKMADGPHSVSVRGLDINGTIGEEVGATFHLDTTNPVNLIVSHKNGSIVKGRVVFEGSVFDLNGVKKLDYSLDGGISYQTLNLTYNKNDNTYLFKLAVETTALKDGPQIYWFKSQDNTGSVGMSAFLFFVDNTKPVIEILSPLPDEVVNGKFMVSGKVSDMLGISKLSYTIDNRIVEIPLVPGNPYFSELIDLTDDRRKLVPLIFSVTDTPGNRIDEKVLFQLDYQADLPLTTITRPVEAEANTGELSVTGWVLDDDGVEEIIYHLDKDEPKSLSADFAFSFIITNVTPGKHSLSLQAKDKNGVLGPESVVNFVQMGPSPEITLLAAGPLSNSQEFHTGIELNPLEKNVLSGKVRVYDQIKEAQLSIKENYTNKISLGKSDQSEYLVFNYNLPADLDYGVNKFQIKLTDVYDRVTLYKDLFYVRNLNKDNSAPGITIQDPTMKDDKGRIIINGDHPLEAFFNGQSLREVTLEPEVGNLRITEERGFITVSALNKGISGPCRIKLTTTEDEQFYSEELTFIIDYDLPSLEIDNFSDIQQTEATLHIKAKVSDDVGIVQSGYALALAESFFPLSHDESGVIDQEVSLASLNNGPGLVWIRAIDEVNNFTQKAIGVIKNSFDFTAEKAQLNFVYPENKAVLKPQEAYVFGYALSDGTISSMRYVLDKEEPKELTAGEPFLIDLNYLEKGTHNINVLALDEKGKIRLNKAISFTIMGPAPDVFLEKIVSKEFEKDYHAGASVNVFRGDIKLNGRVNSEIAELQYRFNDDNISKANFLKIDESWKGFSIAVPKNLSYGKNSLFLKAVDAYGRSREMNSFFYHQALQDLSRITDSDGIYYHNENLDSSGQFRFNNRNDEFQLFFNGRKIKTAILEPASALIEITHENSLLTLKRIKGGISNPLRIMVTTENNRVFQTDEIIFNTDITPPEIKLEYPDNNLWLQNSFFLKAELKDDYQVDFFEYSFDKGSRFQAVNFQAAEDSLSITVNEEVNIESFDDGPLDMILRLGDKSGNITEKNVVLYKDTLASSISLVTPIEGESVNGIITISGAAKDNGRIASMEYSEDGENFTSLEGLSEFKFDLDFSQFIDKPSTVVLKATDRSGNVNIFEPSWLVDFKTDKPVSEIQVPASGQTLKSDFMISGMVFDDDAVGKIYYRIDDQEFQSLDGSNNFSIPIKLDEIDDNEHTVEVYAEDINGVIGEIQSSMFKISKAEPVSVLNSPVLESTVRGLVTLLGASSDKNGIKEVYFSVDNGLSFHKMAGTETWSYTMDTRLLEDGVHRLLFKAIDNADTEGVSSTLISIDNNKPHITLDGPEDGENVTGFLRINGRAEDSLVLSKLWCIISPIDKTEYSQVVINEKTGKEETITRKIQPLSYDLSTDGVFTTELPLEDLPPGWYNLRIEARDQADNMSYISRNFRIENQKDVDRIELIYPMEGQEISGYFSIDGQVNSKSPVNKVMLLLNEEIYETASVNENGYFRFEMEPENIKDGNYIITVQAQLSGNKSLTSDEREINYFREGPWIIINNFKTGDFVTNRPWLEGEAGYHIVPPIDPEDQELLKAFQKKQQEMKLSKLEISFDNGKSFTTINGGIHWKYRLQTQDMAEGEARILVRAIFGNGTITTVRKTILQVDETPPQVVMLNPKEGARFNDRIEILGLASDLNGLSEVTVALRKGDKAGYEVPGFIQGAYLEGKGGLGANLWEVAAGLTFFDQNGKIQVQIGQTPPDQRFGGFTFGVKILLNIFSLPFSVFAGPDWEWLSASVTLGANFTYFTNNDEAISFDKGLLLSAALLQVEFPKVRLRDLSFLNTYSIISEISWWIISSDVKPEFRPKFSAGLRLGLL
ncbi:MAG: hypothetical protein JXR70_00020 [Spirochaetales bacterium]|nr:hypothetical protein [Spirochaetales bacterium]